MSPSLHHCINLRASKSHDHPWHTNLKSFGTWQFPNRGCFLLFLAWSSGPPMSSLVSWQWVESNPHIYWDTCRCMGSQSDPPPSPSGAGRMRQSHHVFGNSPSIYGPLWRGTADWNQLWMDHCLRLVFPMSKAGPRNKFSATHLCWHLWNCVSSAIGRRGQNSSPSMVFKATWKCLKPVEKKQNIHHFIAHLKRNLPTLKHSPIHLTSSNDNLSLVI